MTAKVRAETVRDPEGTAQVRAEMARGLAETARAPPVRRVTPVLRDRQAYPVLRDRQAYRDLRDRQAYRDLLTLPDRLAYQVRPVPRVRPESSCAAPPAAPTRGFA